MARTVLDLLPLHKPARVIDMCCGSGNLSCAVAARRSVFIVAVDLSYEAVALTRQNATQLGLADKIEVVQGDLFNGLRTETANMGFDLVMCNPPYISTSILLSSRANLLAEEPRRAFDGGPYGIDILRRLARESAAVLRPGAHLVFEIGVGQEATAKRLLDRSGGFEAPVLVRDNVGAVRVIVARRTCFG